MRWISLREAAGFPADGSRPDPAELSGEYRAGRAVGVVTLGTRHLFFRRLWKACYIPYDSISRFFRRVIAVPAKIGCCTTGELRVEHLVICAVPDGDGQPGSERELAQIQLPGERAAVSLMEELKRLAPNAAFGKPSQSADSVDADGAGTDSVDRNDLSESPGHKAEADEMLSAERKVHDNKTQGFCVKKQMYGRR